MKTIKYKYNQKTVNNKLQTLLEQLDNVSEGMYEPWNSKQEFSLEELNYDLFLSKCNFTPEPGKKVWVYWNNAVMYDINTSDICRPFEIDEGFLISLPGYQHCYFEDGVVIWVPRPWGYEKCDPDPEWIPLDVLIQYEAISFISDHPLDIPLEVFSKEGIHNKPARKFMLALQKETLRKNKIL